jgi:7-cyano-7-deazaguanosine (preQ0) biosynthesis protein QueE
MTEVTIGRRSTHHLSVSEMFGPTIQGEGPSQGLAVMFVRLGLCNLDCSWCDTPYTWDWTGKNGTKYDRVNELVRMPVADLVDQIKLEAGPVRRVVISGGEPMVQRVALEELVVSLIDNGFDVEIETNGTLMPTPVVLDLAQFNVSPKLANSGVDEDARFKHDVLTAMLEAGATLKFVITTPDDIDVIDDYAIAFDCPPERIYLMPEGIDSDKIRNALPDVMELAARKGYSVSPRLHVIAYNNRRGV